MYILASLGHLLKQHSSAEKVWCLLGVQMILWSGASSGLLVADMVGSHRSGEVQGYLVIGSHISLLPLAAAGGSVRKHCSH